MTLSENPFAPPDATLGPLTDDVAPRRHPLRRDLFTVALLQKVLLLCIAFQVLIYVVWFGQILARPAALGGVVSISIYSIYAMWALRVAAILQLILAWALAFKVYRPLAAIGMGLLTLLLTFVPPTVLIPLICISSRTSRVILKNGFKVGWLGANLAEVKAALSKSNPPVVS